jgi:hypothetical protein
MKEKTHFPFLSYLFYLMSLDARQWLGSLLERLPSPKQDVSPFLRTVKKRGWPLPSLRREQDHVLVCEACQVTYQDLMNRVDRHRLFFPSTCAPPYESVLQVFEQLTEFERQQLHVVLQQDTVSFLKHFKYDPHCTAMHLWYKECRPTEPATDGVEEPALIKIGTYQHMWTLLDPLVKHEFEVRKQALTDQWISAVRRLTPLDAQYYMELRPTMKRYVSRIRYPPRPKSPYCIFLKAKGLSPSEGAAQWNGLTAKEKEAYIDKDFQSRPVKKTKLDPSLSAPAQDGIRTREASAMES